MDRRLLPLRLVSTTGIIVVAVLCAVAAVVILLALTDNLGSLGS
jgi:hypothetical protein